MPSKTTTTKTRARPSADHVSYQDMIIDGIVTLKERNGSRIYSRVALKKYIKANHKNIVDGKMFDSLFNRALKSGVEKGIFAQPKGASGGTKLAKKEVKTSSSKPGSKLVDAKIVDKKTAEKKAVAPKKAVPVKKAVSRKADLSSTKSKPTILKPKVISKTKKPAKAEETSEVPAILSRTKSGRVTKSTPAPRKVIAPKKKTTPAKKATPKK
ncbi:hypothetical protein EPUL_002367, partial [Erysiphe pulchra]